MPQNITDIAVSRGQADEQNLQSQGFKKKNVILNNNGYPAYFWYKSEAQVASITRIQVSYDADTSSGLINAGYRKVETNLIQGENVFLWYFKGTTATSFDTPIVALEVSTNADDEALKMKLGWERAGCNLSGTPGKWVYLWVKREKPTYICDVTATNTNGSDNDLFQAGYIRIDQSTNTWNPFPFPLPPICGLNSKNFLWYRQKPDDKNGITDLQISTNNDQYQEYQQQNYKSVSVNLNEGTGGNAVYLWYKKGQAQVQSMLLLLNESAIDPFKDAGINVNQENINYGNNGFPRHLCVKK